MRPVNMKLRRARVRHSPIIRSKYYYIIAMVKGKRFLAGAYPSREEARATAYKSEELRNVIWDIIESSSRDIDKVRGNLKHKIWQKTDSIEEASQRMRHKL